MAFTKFNFFLGTIFVVILIFVGMGKVGTDLVINDKVDNKSIDYILEIKGLNDQHGYVGIANTTSAESQQSNILDSENGTQVSDTNDFLSMMYIKKERASQPTNFLKLAYNIPTTLIRGLGLDVGDWNDYLNIISFILLIAFIYLIWTKVIS